MPTGLLLIPLFAGYMFLHSCYPFRFRAQRQDGYRLLIESLVAGIPISLVSFFLIGLMRDGYPGILVTENVLRQTQIPFIGTGVVSGVIAIALAVFVNLIFSSVRAKSFIINSHDNGFLRLANQAVTEEKPVSVTLKNKKVYIGLVIRTPSLRPAEQHISILPLSSGYRDPVTLRLVTTENYTRIYREAEVDPTDFAVTIPLSEIESASLFNPAVYPMFLEKSEPAKSVSAPLTRAESTSAGS